MKTCNYVINKGIPSTEGIVIYYDDLLSISNNRVKTKYKIEEALKIIDAYSNLFENNTKSLSKKIDMDLDIAFAINTNIQPIRKDFFVAPQTLVSNILTKLNVDKMGNYYKLNGHVREHILAEDLIEYEEAIVNRFRELTKVSTVNELEYKFPLIYDEYKVKEALLKEADRQRQKIKNKNFSKYEKIKLERYFQYYLDYNGYNYSAKELLSTSPNISIPSFCREYGMKLAYLIDNINKLTLCMMNSEIRLDDTEIDNDKFELYITYQRLLQAINTNSDRDKQNYINLVADYFQRNKNIKDNTDLSITIKNRENYSNYKKELTITPSSLYERLKLLLKENPTIKLLNLSDVDFSKMNLFEVQEYIRECLKDLKANWEIIPDCKYDELVDGPRKKEKYKKYTPSEEKLLKIFMEKKEFFASTDPFFRIKGKNTFKNYIGYIYKNGKVVLERYYHNPKKGKLAYGDAVYTMNIEDFYRISQYPRSIIIDMLKTDSSIGRFPHIKNWKEDVLKIIEENNDNSKTVEEVKQLMKRKKIEE